MPTEDSAPKAARTTSQRVFAAWPIIVVGLMTTFLAGMHRVILGPPAETSAAWGEIGDFLGGTMNPIVAIVTVYLLVRTIELQRQELAETRAEMKEQRKETEKQNGILSLQAFEQSFFSWFASYENAVTEISVTYSRGSAGTTEVFGRTALKSKLSNVLAYESYAFGQNAKQAAADEIALSAEDHDAFFVDILKRWKESYNANIDEFGTLIETLYGLIQWVDSSEMSQDQKSHYVGIIGSRISHTESRLLVLHAASDGGLKGGRYLHRYSLLGKFSGRDESIIRWVLAHPKWIQRRENALSPSTELKFDAASKSAS